MLTGSRRRVPADSRIRAQQNSFNRQQAVEDKRTRPPLRTRVRNPNLPGIRNRHCYLGSYKITEYSSEFESFYEYQYLQDFHPARLLLKKLLQALHSLHYPMRIPFKNFETLYPTGLLQKTPDQQIEIESKEHQGEKQVIQFSFTNTRNNRILLRFIFGDKLYNY